MKLLAYTHELTDNNNTEQAIENALSNFDFHSGMSFENPFPQNPDSISHIKQNPGCVSGFDYLEEGKNWLNEGFTFAELKKLSGASYEKIGEASEAYTQKMEELFKYIRAACVLERIYELEKFEPNQIMSYDKSKFLPKNIEQTINELLREKILLPELKYIPRHDKPKDLLKDKYIEEIRKEKDESLIQYKKFLNYTINFKSPYTLQATIEIKDKISDFNISEEQRIVEESLKNMGIDLLEKEREIYTSLPSLSNKTLKTIVDIMKNSGYVRYVRYDVEDFRRYAFDMFLALKINEYRLSITRGLTLRGINNIYPSSKIR